MDFLLPILQSCVLAANGWIRWTFSSLRFAFLFNLDWYTSFLLFACAVFGIPDTHPSFLIFLYLCYHLLLFQNHPSDRPLEVVAVKIWPKRAFCFSFIVNEYQNFLCFIYRDRKASAWWIFVKYPANVFLYSYCISWFLCSSFVAVIPISLGLTRERIDRFSLISGWFFVIYFSFLSHLVTEKVPFTGSQKAGWVGQLLDCWLMRTG